MTALPTAPLTDPARPSLRHHPPLLAAALAQAPLAVLCLLAALSAFAYAATARNGQAMFLIGAALLGVVGIHRALARHLGAMGRGRRPVYTGPLAVQLGISLGYAGVLSATLVAMLRSSRGADHQAVPFIVALLLYVFATDAPVLPYLVRHQ